MDSPSWYGPSLSMMGSFLAKKDKRRSLIVGIDEDGLELLLIIIVVSSSEIRLYYLCLKYKLIFDVSSLVVIIFKGD